MQMLCNTNDGKHAECRYGYRCCSGTLHRAGHKKKRRVLKRRERQAWKREVRAGGE